MITLLAMPNAKWSEVPAQTFILEDYNEYVIKPQDIDSVFEKVDKNTKGISKLLKDLSKVMARLSSAMRSKSASKQAMTEEQIQAFSDFNVFYADETEELRQELSKLSGDIGHIGFKNKIIGDIDYDILYYWLINISERQHEAIENINGIISAARKTLQLIA